MSTLIYRAGTVASTNTVTGYTYLLPGTADNNINTYYAQSFNTDHAQQYCYAQALSLREQLVKDLMEKLNGSQTQEVADEVPSAQAGR